MDKSFYSEIGRKGAIAYREKSIKKYYESPTYCKHCGKVIELRDDEIPAITKQRVFCSPECRSEFQRQKMLDNKFNKSEPSYCLNCGKELNSHAKKYCNNQCQKEFQYKEYIDKWKNGLVNGLAGEYQLSKHIKRYIKEKFDNKCCECGWNKVNPITGSSPLEVHHKDGNYKNNNEDNLELLCPNCHSLTENYKSLNKNGRKERV